MSGAQGKKGRVLIVGAGISGLTAATALGRQGWQVDVIERKSSIDDSGGVGLTLIGNAMRALDVIGVAHKCVEAGVPADFLNIMRADGTLLMENPVPRIGGSEWPGGTGIRRAAFHAILLEAAGNVISSLRCGETATRWSEERGQVLVTFSTGYSAAYDLMIAADGLNSSTRAELMPDIKPNPSGQACWRVPVPRPPGIDRTHLFFGGKHGAVGVCPISDDLAYMYIVQAYDGGRQDPTRLHEIFADEVEGYGGLIAELVKHVTDPTQVNFSPLPAMIVPKPWGKGRVVLIGDAAHANPPVLAQGAAMGIEDAIVLAEEISATPGDIPDALNRFVERRYDRARRVVEASWQLARAEVEHRKDVDIHAIMRETAMQLAAPM
ncbi:FAD-dependent monooxygenase [Nitrospirillum iridis]|uniref:2-polyprenyl-6-methoxyphenol hydroxylase-like FAD-dependent oxidoreductase n=1 Tax=Nitrospirillum iridis TaxID=765888 RepID=A0A7X0B3U3_9PROT|nr:FAD-dependent monooxygenase [Nitrospirillum iridis]MBB6255173.1 2-polyprenyl-6-methoxyphenol hydroxylase-like FAD-dependent oxidoreductase [Nitrospirillum iridis]